MRPPSHHSRGTVSLVALCFVIVLGISLASYLTICSRSMTLSDRSFQSGMGQQLAELGLEEGLRAYNKGDWGGWASNPSGITGGTTAWTIDATNKRASRTLTYDTTRLGQNVTATVKIRIDNYDANVLGAPYNSSTAYRLNDLVGYSGTWYRCIKNGTGQTPAGMANLTYWVPASTPWTWISNYSYKADDVVNYNGRWYQCTTTPTTSATWSGTNWSMINSITSYSGAASYSVNDIVNYPLATTWYKWTGSSWSPLPGISWQWKNGTIYTYNDVVYYYNGSTFVWYRFVNATPTSGITPGSNTAYWEDALTGANTTSSTGAQGWSSSSIIYNLGDIVCYGASYNWYRCIRGHASSGSILPTNTTYWATTPLLSQMWQSNRQYSQYDTVRYKSVWYLCLSSSTGQIPTNASSGYWAAAPRAIRLWNSSTFYEVDDLVSNSGTWYRCIAPHNNQATTNTTYWTVLTGSGNSYVWSGGLDHSVGEYRSYDGVWYKCITATVANDGHSPNDSGYWTAAWAQPSNTSVTTGAPVVYAESSVALAGSPAITTQLRATIGSAPLFPNAVGSASTLIIGSGGTVDAYDGSVRSMRTGGTTNTYTYNDQVNSPFSATNPNIGYTAKLAATGTSSPSLTVTSTTVKGFAAASPASTTPFAPLATFGSGAYLQNSDGSTTSPDAIATHVDLSRVSRSPYVPQFDTQPAGDLGTAFTNANFPRGTAIPTSSPPATINLGIPGATVPARYYFDGDLVIGGGSINTVNIRGPVVLYINGNLQITGGSTNVLTIYTTGSAEIHVATSLKVDLASIGIDNKTLDPKKLIIICHTAASSTQYYQDGSTVVYGTIYAPYTTNSTGLYFNSASTTTWHGAISAAKMEFANNATVHYDTSLRYATFGGVDQPYTVTEWRDLPIVEQATMP